MSNLLITGGTGSLGNAIIDNLIGNYGNYDNGVFDKIIVYSRDEQKQELMKNKYNSHPQLRFLIGDVRDKERLNLAVKGVKFIVHAAAMKIVPSVEYNPIECIKTNIIGTQNLIEVTQNVYGVEKVLFISTDKAVNPINLYGATKLAAEKLIIAANHISGINGPKYSVARYGNVANSNGSVIPFFMKQIDEGKPLSITHKDMTRFWITLPQAANFVINRLHNMIGNEIFIPDMQSFRVMDLVNILNSNTRPHFGGINYKIIGIRPGEKIHEDLISHHELPYVDDTLEYFIISDTVNEKNYKFIENYYTEGGKPKSYNSSSALMDYETLQCRLADAGFIENVKSNTISCNFGL